MEAHRHSWYSGQLILGTVLMVMGNAYMTGQTVQLNGGMNFI